MHRYILMTIIRCLGLFMLNSNLDRGPNLCKKLAFLFVFLFWGAQAFTLEISHVEGNVMLDQPGKAKVKMEASHYISRWDKIKVGDAGKLSLITHTGAIVEVSKNSLLQVVKCKFSKILLVRILKGRLRVVNDYDSRVRIETLNAVLNVAKGKTDVIISAMNTLVAPREGRPVGVNTQQHTKYVSAGFYGLVNSEGVLMQAVAAGNKGSTEKKVEGDGE